MMGSCDNDTITISGADPVTMKNFPSNLCGVLTGSHVYISVKDVEEVTITITLSSLSTQKWNILVRQFDSTQTEYLAPRGCLQYYREDAGMLETFNYNGGNGELLNSHMYTMCIAQNDLYCDIALTSSSFMLGGSAGMCSDAVVFGTNQLCGSTFGTAGQLNCKYQYNGMKVYAQGLPPQKKHFGETDCLRTVLKTLDSLQNTCWMFNLIKVLLIEIFSCNTPKLIST